jgi:hypothetical protein
VSEEEQSMEIPNQARGYSYMLGVLKNREGDPFCNSCNSFLTTLAVVNEKLEKFEHEHGAEIGNLPTEISLFYSVAKSGIRAMKQPADPAGQKKLGNCKLPEGVCFLKSTLSILQKI